MDNVHLQLFPFSLLGKAKTWFYTYKEGFNTWDACSNAFLFKYFLMGKTNALRNRISSFEQLLDERVPEAWELLQEYIAACPHHGMEEWLIIQNFFHGLNQRSQDHMEAAVGGAFLSLDVARAKVLIDKIVPIRVGREIGSRPIQKEYMKMIVSICWQPRWIFS